MDWEEVIIGGLAVIWGVILLFARPHILEFSLPGGKGLRDRRVLGTLVITAAVLLMAGGVAMILSKSL